jgi:hypothetical protein
MRLTRVNSLALDAVGYEPGERLLVVRFKSGETYEYLDVDRSLFEALVTAAHPWTEYGELVKSHRYRHVG